MVVDFREFNSESNLREQRLLYGDSFPEAHVAAGAQDDHYFWKFHKFPAKKPSYEFASWDGLKLIGYYAALPYPYMIGGKPVTCGMVCDVMTHSQARGKGIFTSLGQYSLTQLKAAGIGFVSGYPIRPNVLPGHLKVGWQVAFRLPLYFKVLRLNSALKTVKLGLLSPLGNWMARGYHMGVSLSHRRGFMNYRSEVLDTSGFLQLKQYDVFFEKWAGQFKNYLIKSREFLGWRLSAPRTKYRIITVWDGKILVGIAITRKIEFHGIPCLAILDLMVLPDHRGLNTKMHDEIENEARKGQSEMIVAMMTPTSARRLSLLRHGFMFGPTAFKLIVNRLDDSITEEQLTDEANWNLMWIDSDDN